MVMDTQNQTQQANLTRNAMIIRRHALTISHDSNQAYTLSSDRNTVKFRKQALGLLFFKGPV